MVTKTPTVSYLVWYHMLHIREKNFMMYVFGTLESESFMFNRGRLMAYNIRRDVRVEIDATGDISVVYGSSMATHHNRIILFGGTSGHKYCQFAP
jgi:hypothetical protein